MAQTCAKRSGLVRQSHHQVAGRYTIIITFHGHAGQSTVCANSNKDCVMVWGETVSIQDTINRYGPGLAACALCALGSDAATFGGATPADPATCAVCAAPLLADVGHLVSELPSIGLLYEMSAPAGIVQAEGSRHTQAEHRQLVRCGMYELIGNLQGQCSHVLSIFRAGLDGAAERHI